MEASRIRDARQTVRAVPRPGSRSSSLLPEVRSRCDQDLGFATTLDRMRSRRSAQDRVQRRSCWPRTISRSTSAVLRRVRRRRGRRHGRALERPSPWHALAGEGCRVRHVGWRRPADRSAPAGGARAYQVSRCSRMTLMTRGLVITATTRNDAPQRGQWPMSIPNSRRKRCIQVIATRPRFARPPRRRLRTWALAPRRRGGGGEH